MKKTILLSINLLIVSTLSFGQSTLIEPNSNNGILSQNVSAVTTDPGLITLPTALAGTRLMWIPAKSAFRVGTVSNSSLWNSPNIGTWSTAFGYNNIASGNYSMAVGNQNTASGITSSAFGGLNTASNTYAMVWGISNTASGSSSTAFGYSNTASGFASTSMGENTFAKAEDGFTIGSFNNNSDNPNANSPTTSDRIFQIGNGTDDTHRSNALTVLRNGNIGIGTLTTNEKLEVNGRLRLARGAFASGIWFNNSANGTALSDGAFVGMNNETPGSETIGFWLNGGFRFVVDRAGNTTLNGGISVGGGQTVNKIIKTSVTSTLTSFNANSFTSQNFTVTGVSVGDNVIATPGADIGIGIISSVYVSANDTVTIKFYNPTGSSSFPVNNFVFYFTVLK